jgi:urocanate hydratase
MLNQEIFNAMTIKLTAYDIPLEVPKFDPKIRRAPKRVVHLEKDEIALALKNNIYFKYQSFKIKTNTCN